MTPTTEPAAPPDDGAAQPARPRLAAVALPAALLVAAAYATSLHNGFHFDDSHVLETNLFVRSLSNVPRFFTDARTMSSLPANSDYRPLVATSLALDYRVAGSLDPFVFHVSQLAQLLALWGALAVLYRKLFDLARRHESNGLVALFAATLFAVHTGNTETMNLMHARSEILSALGVAGGLLVWLGSRRLRRSGLYLVPVALGALAKPPAVVFGPLLFVLVLLAVGRWRGTRLLRGPGRRAALVAARAALPAIVAGAGLFLLVRAMSAPGQTYGGGDRWRYALTQLWVWVRYTQLFFLPAGLSADTDLGLLEHWWDTRALVGAVLIAGLAWAFLAAARRPRAWPVAFGLAWYAIGLAPTSSVMPLAEPTNDHRMFLAFAGLTPAVVWAVRLAAAPRAAASPGARNAIVLGCVAVLGAHAVGTAVRNTAWRDGESLWRDVTRKSPGNGRGQMNYGLALMARGDLAGARSSFEKAKQLLPNYAYLEVNLGVLEAASGHHAEAEAHFRRALALDASAPATRSFYARWLTTQGRSPEAIELLREALRASPADLPSRHLLLDLCAARGDAAALAEASREALRIAPDDPRARAYAAGGLPPLGAAGYQPLFDLGLSLGSRRLYPESAVAYLAALDADPRSADALNNLGWTLGQMGFADGARRYLALALSVRPGWPLAAANLAAFGGAPGPAPAPAPPARTPAAPQGEPPAAAALELCRRGKGPEAVRLLSEALRRAPASVPALSFLMELHGARGDRQGAARTARQLLRVGPADARAKAWAGGRAPVDGPPGYEALFGLGLTLGAQKRYVESAVAYRAALDADPRSADTRNNLGWTLGELGFVEEARVELREALRIRPGWDLARNNLAQLDAPGR